MNSSGKSTISNFIFYVLGGAYSHWTSEAAKCKEVIAEVVFNGATITLRRAISTSSFEPMSVYWNNYVTASQDSLNWQMYPYKQTSNLISFSNVLFNALSLPEVKTDIDSNITMHQVLRLLYIDQDTPTQSLFRFERFDQPLVREAISEILLGVYDDSLYTDRLNLKQALKDSDEKKREFDNLNKILNQTGAVTNVNGIQKEIDEARESLKKIEISILELRGKSAVRTTKKTELSSERIQSELSSVKNEIRRIKDFINRYELEIADSKQFIDTLKKRVTELSNSLLTRKVLGELPLTHCPQCLSPLDTHSIDGACHLCKQPLSEEVERANAKRLFQEMELQIKESSSLLDYKNKNLAELVGVLPSQIEKARLLQKQLDDSVNNPQTTRDERIDTLLIQKGGIENNISYLIRQMKVVELIELLKDKLKDLAAVVKALRLSISEKETAQNSKYHQAMSKIKELTLYILKNDLDRQEEFRSGKVVEIDFLRDTYSLDGGNNFSASSKTYFKNAVLFAIFFASLELDFLRYPRFILCDNMEDKGMEKARTQNFQNLITAMSDSYDQPHQIIFTTSMVSDELNNKPYCVGNDYTRTDKTLILQ
jgi:hypothetical protein